MLATLGFIGASVWTLMYYKNQNPIRSFTILTCLYMISLMFIGSFDFIMPLYCLFLILTMGRRYSFKVSSMIYIIYIGCYFLAGILFQDFVLTVTTAVTRYGYILIFIAYAGCHRQQTCRKSDFRFVIHIGLLTELLMILCVWIRDGFGARVISNNQPLGGGIVIALIILVGIGYKKRYFKTGETLLYSVLSVVIVILSGTRGYMVILGLPLFVILLMIVLDVPGYGIGFPLRISISLFLMFFAMLGLALFTDMEWLADVFRMREGLGYRGNENLFVELVRESSSVYRNLTGYGFGGSAQILDNYKDILREASGNRAYMYSKLCDSTIFHNYWNTIWYKQGILGLAAVGCIFGGIFYQIYQRKASLWIKLILAGSVLGTIISLTFRITATCSVFEFLILGYVLYGLRSKRE